MGGSNADFKEAVMPMENLSRKALLTERGYSTNEVIEYTKKSDVYLVIHLYKRTVNHNANAMQKIPSRQKMSSLLQMILCILPQPAV